MEEVYVSKEIGRMLHEAGCDWCNSNNSVFYSEDGFEDCPDGFYAPRLDVAQRWLREVKNCYVGVEVFVHDLDKNNIYYTYNWVVYFNGNRYSGSDFDTTRYYEEALEAGIKKCLDLMKSWKNRIIYPSADKVSVIPPDKMNPTQRILFVDR